VLRLFLACRRGGVSCWEGRRPFSAHRSARRFDVRLARTRLPLDALLVTAAWAFTWQVLGRHFCLGLRQDFKLAVIFERIFSEVRRSALRMQWPGRHLRCPSERSVVSFQQKKSRNPTGAREQGCSNGATQMRNLGASEARFHQKSGATLSSLAPPPHRYHAAHG